MSCMSDKFKAIGDTIIVEPLEENQGSIVLPQQSKKKPTRGRVKNVGPGIYKDRHPIDVKVGDIIIFRQWSGTEFSFNNVDYIQISYSDVIAVLLDSEKSCS